MTTHTSHSLPWLRLWRRRCCPPEHVLHAPADKALREHLQLCSWCRQDQARGATGFSPPPIPRGLGTASPPQPGQLWSITDSLAGWGPKGRYYNPPLVLIVAILPEAVTVVQTCGETDFAAADDVTFPAGIQGFAQPWNRYTLRHDDLGFPFGQVFATLPPALLDPAHHQAIQLTPGSLLWFFRQLEVESGYFFARQAVTALMTAHETQRMRDGEPLAQLQTIDPHTLCRQLTGLGLLLPADLPAECDALTQLALARPADDALPLAAADADTPTEYAINVILRNGVVAAARPLTMHVDTWQPDGALLYVSGRLTAAVPGTNQPLIWLQTLDRRFDPLPGEFGLEGDFFWALFNVGDAKLENGECLVRIVSTS
ncbi:MAG: hypothetical protein BWK76_06720 [Desulfobulbaceae bacterium A2]|nr:MAG: hypothetical protein BWK76_06720 [Desulfobulbaceae bacterium A2]